jgi:hypothetical protein
MIRIRSLMLNNLVLRPKKIETPILIPKRRKDIDPIVLYACWCGDVGA